jgi:hypothetical protein
MLFSLEIPFVAGHKDIGPTGYGNWKIFSRWLECDMTYFLGGVAIRSSIFFCKARRCPSVSR